MKKTSKLFFGATIIAGLGLSTIIAPVSTNAESIENVIPTITNDATVELNEEAAANWILNPDWFIQSDEPTRK